MGITKRELGLFSKREADVAPEGKPGLLLDINFRHKYDAEAKKTLEELEAVVVSVYFEEFGRSTIDIKIPAERLPKFEIDELQRKCQQGEKPVRFDDLVIGLYNGKDGVGISSTATGIRFLTDADLEQERLAY